MYSRALEADGLGFASIPLVHLSDVVHTRTLLAREIARGQRRAGECIFAERDRVQDGHMCSSTGSERQEDGGRGKHVDVERVT